LAHARRCAFAQTRYRPKASEAAQVAEACDAWGAPGALAPDDRTRALEVESQAVHVHTKSTAVGAQAPAIGAQASHIGAHAEGVSQAGRIAAEHRGKA